ncbi:hypothetical protein ECP030230811_4966 [Escherichia coli P0302308.11]|nr:hypothetical protein ECP030230811_4966 [Escherichia coli P0302308.11]
MPVSGWQKTKSGRLGGRDAYGRYQVAEIAAYPGGADHTGQTF